MTNCCSLLADVHPNLSALPLVLVGLTALALGLAVYGRAIGRVHAGLGKVRTEGFVFPDLLVVFVLGSWLGGMSVQGFLRPEVQRQITVRDLLQSALLFALLAGGLVGFLKYRGRSILQLFGLGQPDFALVARNAAGYLLAAYPMVLLCNGLMQTLLGDKARKQEIMEYFVDAIQHSDRGSMIVTAIIGVCVAPVLEEIIFRGYFYGALRRHFGPMAGMIASALLFAVIHVNGVALPSLFVLAVCLTLAYEATGTLLVPMTMHATFNAVTLGLTFIDAQGQR